MSGTSRLSCAKLIDPRRSAFRQADSPGNRAYAWLLGWAQTQLSTNLVLQQTDEQSEGTPKGEAYASRSVCVVLARSFARRALACARSRQVRKASASSAQLGDVLVDVVGHGGCSVVFLTEADHGRGGSGRGSRSDRRSRRMGEPKCAAFWGAPCVLDARGSARTLAALRERGSDVAREAPPRRYAAPLRTAPPLPSVRCPSSRHPGGDSARRNPLHRAAARSRR